MLRLQTFGGLHVLREDGSRTELTQQRRRIAVLAIVAAAAPRPVARERVLQLLWPDVDDERGRGALNQILYNLRRELGVSPIDGVAELALVPDVMRSDLSDFRDALARGDRARAAECYVGPFLDGFSVPGAGEFERWADEERLRTTRQAITAIEALAAAAAQAGDHDALLTWTGRLVELDPLNARHTLTHMRALAQAGDRDAAIAYGRRYEVVARADGDEVDPAVAQEMARLRATPSSASIAVMPEQAPAPDVAPADASTSVAPELAAVPLTVAAADGAPGGDVALARAGAPPGPEAPPARIGAWRWRVAIPALLALVGGMWWSSVRGNALPIDADDRVLVADAELPAADSANVSAITFALQSALQQSSRVRVVSGASISDALRRMGRAPGARLRADSTALEVAEREGARYVVSLSAVSSGADRALTLRVLEPAGGNALRTYRSTVSADDLLAGIDKLAGLLRRDLGDSRGDVAAAVPLPRATTPSLEALKLLASGSAAFNRGLYGDARKLYSSALALDSNFAAAYAGRAAVEYTMNNVVAGDSSMARAMALADRLPPRERLLIEATAERGRGAWDKAAVLHRAYLVRYPNDYDVYGQLGYDLMRSRDPEEALEAFDSLRAHRPLSANALINIATIESQLAHHAAARGAYAQAVHVDTAILTRNIQNEEIGANLIRLGFVDSARAVFSVMLRRNEADQARGHRSLAYADLYEGRYASAVRHLQAAVTIGPPHGGGAQSEVRDRALLASTLIELGQMAPARQQLLTGANLCLTISLDPRLLLWTGKPAARLGDTLTARRLLDSARVRARASDNAQMAAVAALEAELQSARNDQPGAIASARRAVATDSGSYVSETLARALERAGRSEEARQLYAMLADAPRPSIGREAQQLEVLAPLALARLELRAGRRAEAERILDQFLAKWPLADADLPFVVSLRSQLAAAR